MRSHAAFPRACAVRSGIPGGTLALFAVSLALMFVCLDTAHAQDTQVDETNSQSESEADSLDDIDTITELSLEDLMDIEVVVTASRHEQKGRTLPYAVSVITAEDIRRSGAGSVPDALRLVPGVDVADLTSGQFAVSPRGFAGFLGRQVLVLVDGRQIYDSHFGGNLWGSWPFQLEDIERIEVIRGPGGVAWGANAVNGVINVITKDPKTQLGATVSVAGGSRGFNKTHVGYAWEESDTRIRLSLEYEGHDGFRKGGAIAKGLDDELKAARLGLHAIRTLPSGDTLTFSLGHATMDGGFASTPLGGIGSRRNAGSQTSYVMLTWEHRVDNDNQVQVRGYVNDSWGAPGIRMIDYRYQQFALQIAQTRKVNEGYAVSWGIDGRADLLDATNADPRMLSRGFLSTGIVGIYGQADWTLEDRWSVNLGARLDYEFYGGLQPSARASLTKELSDRAVVYGSVSRAFQMPPVGLRFLDLPLLNGTAIATGNRSMDPEVLWAYELGYRTTYGENLALSANLFWHEYDDVTTLSARLGPPGLINFRIDNRGSASLYGVELESTYEVTSKLTLLANYTYQQLQWRSKVPFTDKDAMTPPEHKAMMGVRYSPTKDWHFSGYLSYVDEVRAPFVDFPFVSRRIDDYVRLDLVAEHDFEGDAASVRFGVRNLLDNYETCWTTTIRKARPDS